MTQPPLLLLNRIVRLVKGGVALLLVTCLNATAADNSEPSRLAVISALGNFLTIVEHVPQVGTNIDRNRRQSISTLSTDVDDLVLATAIDVLKRADSRFPTIIPMSVSGSHDVNGWFRGRLFYPPSELRSGLSDAAATHLMIVGRFRAPTLIKTGNESIGSGYLDGLGFYIDRSQQMRRANTAEMGFGVLAPYTYFKEYLVDLRSGELVREQSVTASNSFSAAKSKHGTDPWNALDAAEKVSAIRRLIASERTRVLPGLLGQP